MIIIKRFFVFFIVHLIFGCSLFNISVEEIEITMKYSQNSFELFFPTQIKPEEIVVSINDEVSYDKGEVVGKYVEKAEKTTSKIILKFFDEMPLGVVEKIVVKYNDKSKVFNVTEAYKKEIMYAALYNKEAEKKICVLLITNTLHKKYTIKNGSAIFFSQKNQQTSLLPLISYGTTNIKSEEYDYLLFSYQNTPFENDPFIRIGDDLDFSDVYTVRNFALGCFYTNLSSQEPPTPQNSQAYFETTAYIPKYKIILTNTKLNGSSLEFYYTIITNIITNVFTNMARTNCLFQDTRLIVKGDNIAKVQYINHLSILLQSRTKPNLYKSVDINRENAEFNDTSNIIIVPPETIRSKVFGDNVLSSENYYETLIDVTLVPKTDPNTGRSIFSETNVMDSKLTIVSFVINDTWKREKQKPLFSLPVDKSFTNMTNNTVSYTYTWDIFPLERNMRLSFTHMFTNNDYVFPLQSFFTNVFFIIDGTQTIPAEIDFTKNWSHTIEDTIDRQEITYKANIFVSNIVLNLSGDTNRPVGQTKWGDKFLLNFYGITNKVLNNFDKTYHVYFHVWHSKNSWFLEELVPVSTECVTNLIGTNILTNTTLAAGWYYPVTWSNINVSATNNFALTNVKRILVTTNGGEAMNTNYFFITQHVVQASYRITSKTEQNITNTKFPWVNTNTIVMKQLIFPTSRFKFKPDLKAVTIASWKLSSIDPANNKLTYTLDESDSAILSFAIGIYTNTGSEIVPFKINLIFNGGGFK